MKRINNNSNTFAAQKTPVQTSASPSSFLAGAGENPRVPADAGSLAEENLLAGISEDARKAMFAASVMEAVQKDGVDVSEMDLEVWQLIDRNHQDVLWYGGQVATVTRKGFIFSLEARGDINVSLHDAETNEIICEAKGSTDNQLFYLTMQEYLADDQALIEAEENFQLIMENNNWFEVFVFTPLGNMLDKTWTTNSGNMGEAIQEMIAMMDGIIEEYSEYAEEEENAVYEGEYADIAMQFARLWGQHECVNFPSMEAKYMNTFQLDEMAALMRRWAKQYMEARKNLNVQSPTLGNFFFEKLREMMASKPWKNGMEVQ